MKKLLYHALIAGALAIPFGAYAQVATPALPQVVPAFADPFPGKACTINVAAGGSVTSALSSARSGDVVCLAAGATYGMVNLPARASGDTGWIVLRTNTSIPSEGTRITPSTASNFAKIQVPYGGTPAFTTTPGTHHWFIRGIEISPASSVSLTYALVELGTNGASQDTMAEVPQKLILSQMYIHGSATGEMQRCIALNSGETAIVDSYLSECHGKGYDSQVIGGWNGPGPHLIRNNYLEGVGENLMWGGATPAIPNMVASDITIQQNYIYTPLSWKGVWTKKNLLETKNAQRLLIEDNIFDGSWLDAQTGNGILFKSINDQGNCDWCKTADVTFRRNLVRNVGTGIVFSGSENYNGFGAFPPVAQRFLIQDVVFENVNVAPYNGGGRGIQITSGADHITFDRTVVSGNLVGFFTLNDFVNGTTVSPQASYHTSFKDSVFGHGYYFATPCMPCGLGAMNYGIPGFQWSGMTIWTNGPWVDSGWSQNQLPTGTTVVGTESQASRAVQIRATVSAATAGAISGVWSGTPPPPPPPPAPTPPPTSGNLTPTNLMPTVGPLIARSTGQSEPLLTYDTRFKNCTNPNSTRCDEEQHYLYYLTQPGSIGVAENHYGFLRSRIQWAIRTGKPYGQGVTDASTYEYARGREVVLKYLSAYSVPNNYGTAPHNNTGQKDIEMLYWLEGNQEAKNHLWRAASAGTWSTDPYTYMQYGSAEGRIPAIFLEAINAAHRMGIPYQGFPPFLAAGGGFDPAPGSWKAAGERLINITIQNGVAADGSIPSDSHWLTGQCGSAPRADCEAYFMNALLAIEYLRWHGFVAPNPAAYDAAKRIMDHLIAKGGPNPCLPYLSTDTACADDLSAYYVWPSMVLWQETGDVKYKNFALANLTNTHNSYLGYVKQHNQTYSTGAQNTEAMLAGVSWKGAGTVTPPPPPPSGSPPYVSLFASPTSITSGGSSMLTWSSTNSTSCSASGGWTGTKATSGNQSVTPTGNTTYTLSCTGSGGTTTQSVTVTVSSVTPPPPPSPTPSPTPPPPSGTFPIGSWIQLTANTNVRSQPTTGATTVLGMEFSGSIGQITGGPVSANGYTWWNVAYTNGLAGWSIGTYMIQTTAPTNPPPASPPPPPPASAPTVSIYASVATVNPGQATTLIWSSTNSTSCSASGGWNGTKATSGSESVTPVTVTTYTLTCTGNGGSISRSVTVNVNSVASPGSSFPQCSDGIDNDSDFWIDMYDRDCSGPTDTSEGGGSTALPPPPPPPSTPVLSFNASPPSISAGQSSALSWSSTNSTGCTASGGWSGTRAVSGSMLVSPTLTTTYTLTCTGLGGSATQSVTVSVTTGGIRPQCSDRMDNDSDFWVDYPYDKNCTDAMDTSELN